jgi:hypothetical protein
VKSARLLSLLPINARPNVSYHPGDIATADYRKSCRWSHKSRYLCRLSVPLVPSSRVKQSPGVGLLAVSSGESAGVTSSSHGNIINQHHHHSLQTTAVPLPPYHYTHQSQPLYTLKQHITSSTEPASSDRPPCPATIAHCLVWRHIHHTINHLNTH